MVCLFTPFDSPRAATVGDARFELPCSCNSFFGKAIKDLESGIDELQTKIEERKKSEAHGVTRCNLCQSVH